MLSLPRGRMKHHLTLYAPANPHRMDPDTWRRVVHGQVVWDGPLSGNAWQLAYADKPGKKPAPAYNDCTFMGRSVHQDVCVAAVYEPCKKCRVPQMYTGVRLFVRAAVKQALLNTLKRSKR